MSPRPPNTSVWVREERARLRADKLKMYDVFDDKREFLMRAPMATIEAVWMLHPEAVVRVDVACMSNDKICQLHANGRLRLGGEFVLIQLARGPCGHGNDNDQGDG